jgi:hypothetical protein
MILTVDGFNQIKTFMGSEIMNQVVVFATSL